MKIDKSLILDEIKKYLNIKSDKDFCIYLGIKPNVLSNWKKRNTFDIDKITQKCEFISIDYLLTGKGPMLITPNEEITIAEESNTGYNINNQNQINMNLLEKISTLEKQIEFLQRQIDHGFREHGTFVTKEDLSEIIGRKNGTINKQVI